MPAYSSSDAASSNDWASCAVIRPGISRSWRNASASPVDAAKRSATAPERVEVGLGGGDRQLLTRFEREHGLRRGPDRRARRRS